MSYCIKRVEVLELPTWDEFKEDSKSFYFYGKDHCKYRLYKYESCIYIQNMSRLEDVFNVRFDNVGYTSIYRKCRNIFLGE